MGGEIMKYPLGEHHKESITSKTGKKLTDITLDEVMKGHVSSNDIKISKEKDIANKLNISPINPRINIAKYE
mgnify:CR=1 FL=1